MNASRFLLRSAPALALCLAACGGSADHYDVTVGTEHAQFNKGIHSSMSPDPSTGLTIVRLSGNVDPVPNAQDDEYTYTLYLDFNSATLANLPRGTAMPVHGTANIDATSYSANPTDASVTFDPSTTETHTAGIAKVWFERECFCGYPGGLEHQVVAGTVTLDDGENGALRVRAELTVDGPVPLGDGSSQHSVISADMLVLPPTR